MAGNAWYRLIAPCHHSCEYSGLFLSIYDEQVVYNLPKSAWSVAPNQTLILHILLDCCQYEFMLPKRIIWEITLAMCSLGVFITVEAAAILIPQWPKDHHNFIQALYFLNHWLDPQLLSHELLKAPFLIIAIVNIQDDWRFHMNLLYDLMNACLFPTLIGTEWCTSRCYSWAWGEHSSPEWLLRWAE